MASSYGRPFLASSYRQDLLPTGYRSGLLSVIALNNSAIETSRLATETWNMAGERTSANSQIPGSHHSLFSIVASNPSQSSPARHNRTSATSIEAATYQTSNLASQTPANRHSLPSSVAITGDLRSSATGDNQIDISTGKEITLQTFKSAPPSLITLVMPSVTTFRELPQSTIKESSVLAATDDRPGTSASSEAVLINTITSPPPEFSTTQVTNTEFTGNTVIVTTDSSGHSTVVPVLWHNGGPVALWGLPKLPKVSFKLPGLPEFCLVSCGGPPTPPGVPVTKGGSGSEEKPDNKEDTNRHDKSPSNTADRPSSQKITSERTSKTTSRETTTDSASTHESTHTSNSATTTCMESTVTNTYVSCTTATSQSTTACKTSYSIITGCSMAATATTTLLPCSETASASGCGPTAVDLPPVAEIDMLFAEPDEGFVDLAPVVEVDTLSAEADEAQNITTSSTSSMPTFSSRTVSISVQWASSQQVEATTSQSSHRMATTFKQTTSTLAETSSSPSFQPTTSAKSTAVARASSPREEKGPPPTRTLTAPSQKCHGLMQKKYVTRNTLKDIIKDRFCPEAVKQGALDENSGSISRTYLQGTIEEVAVATDWKPGLDFTPNSKDCERYLIDMALDGCDGNDGNNPMNWKGGGSVSVGPVTYRIDPIAMRQPAPKQPAGVCVPIWSKRPYLFRVWGNGWLNSDSGRELEKKLKEKCHLTEFRFEYGLGNYGSEWTMSISVSVLDTQCLVEALQSAGGPKKLLWFAA
ncbi:hypothetical protein PRK78_006668 [Emydomyces testavorans]|uniref:Uncharacterized protein n=1 Tax=Emydomyces testavorans TaxID=2070801 RepID=A0AAF0DMX5_9EURO|nr:hypothetical protein PRK78_006668 [Emydomyces testavorans]